MISRFLWKVLRIVLWLVCVLAAVFVVVVPLRLAGLLDSPLWVALASGFGGGIGTAIATVTFDPFGLIKRL
jgi:hypothetical protein